MRRILNIGSEERQLQIPVRITFKAARIYRAEFGNDLIEDLTDTNQRLSGINMTQIWASMRGKDIDLSDEKAVTQAILSEVNFADIGTDRPLTFEETERSARIVWAFAKADNPSLPGVEDWIDSFEGVLPFREIVGTLYSLWIEATATTVTLKNG